MDVLERLAHKDLGWWAVGDRREVARRLAGVWADRSPAPAGAQAPWPRDHGIADLLIVLRAELQRSAIVPECPELDALRAL